MDKVEIPAEETNPSVEEELAQQEQVQQDEVNTKQDTETTKQEEGNKDNDSNETEAKPSTITDILEKAGLEENTLSEAIANNGQLEEEHYEALEKIGFSRDVVNAYVAGQVALAERETQELFSVVGGEEEFSKVQEWAAENLSKDEIEAYNKVVSEGDMSQAKLALSGLHARFVAAQGTQDKEPQLINGNKASSNDVYSSRNELVKDMQDPRYLQGDPSFHKQVQEKLARSSIF